MTIFVEVVGGDDFGYESDICPRVDEMICKGEAMTEYRIISVSHRVAKRVTSDTLYQQVVDVKAVKPDRTYKGKKV